MFALPDKPMSQNRDVVVKPAEQLAQQQRCVSIGVTSLCVNHLIAADHMHRDSESCVIVVLLWKCILQGTTWDSIQLF